MMQFDKNGRFDKRATNEEIYNRFNKERKYFRKIITIEEKNMVEEWSDPPGSILHEIWQSIDEPWIFLFYNDFSIVEKHIDEYAEIVKKNQTGSSQFDSLSYKNWLKKLQKEKFETAIEGEQYPTQLNMYKELERAIKLDVFTDFEVFRQKITNFILNTTVFRNKRTYHYQGLTLTREKTERLLFHALNHPEQYVKETIGEEIDKLVKSFGEIKGK